MKALLKRNRWFAMLLAGVGAFVFGIAVQVGLEAVAHLLFGDPAPLSQKSTFYLTVGVLWLAAFLLMYPLVGYLERRSKSERTRQRLEYLRYFFMFLLVMTISREDVFLGSVEASEIVGAFVGALVATLIFTPISRHLGSRKRTQQQVTHENPDS